jgi:hypothetical protein
MEKHVPATNVWYPKMDRGWGTSPFNKNGWRTVGGDPIIPADVTKSAKVGAAPLAKEVYNVVLKAPAGKFRVVGVDLFSHEDYLKGDYASEAEAYKVADDHGPDQWMTFTTYTTIRARTSGQ